MFRPQNLFNISAQTPAVIENDMVVCYGDFVKLVAKWFRYFHEKKINKVILDLPQGIDGYSIIWAAYLSGSTFCSLPAETPIERKKILVGQFQPDLIIKINNEQFEGYQVVTPRAIKYELFIHNDFFHERRIIPNDQIAYVMFTSGSTGIPKGVKVARKSMENFLNWSCDEYKVKEGDRWAQYSGLGFDLSIVDIFTCLSEGGTLVVFENLSKKIFPARSIKSQEISIWHSVPTVIDMMVQAEQVSKDYLGKIRVMSFCGAKLFRHHLDVLFAANPNLIIYNNYGPTEGTIYCTSQKLTFENYKQFCSDTVSIGSAIPGYKILLDSNHSDEFEIIISSEFISEGYLCNLTPSPFDRSNVNGVFLKSYRTGDFVKKIDGQLYFYCRKDSQVKNKGHRVDLNEIDYWLRIWNPGVPCLTIFYDNKIISFIQSNCTSTKDILDFLSSKLPFYFLPEKIILVEAFPYNQNQKVSVESLISMAQNNYSIIND